ncbi:hypothetical protein TNCV_946391 [Trichonephila clavipes]|nr:hypothetical protein TNCV_946391 [Trichonephila clavipes]
MPTTPTERAGLTPRNRFLGHPEKFAGCGPLQFAHLAGALFGFLQSEVRWPPEHFKHLGAMIAKPRVMIELLASIALRRHV